MELIEVLAFIIVCLNYVLAMAIPSLIMRFLFDTVADEVKILPICVASFLFCFYGDETYESVLSVLRTL